MHTLYFRKRGQLLAELAFDSGTLKRVTPLQPAVIDIPGHFTPGRVRSEDFIRSHFRASYGAEISVSYPTLMSVQNGDGRILAAAGFRPAVQGPLFLEQYTRTPIEDVLSRLYGETVARHEVAEIGNLASEGKGASVFLFAAIASYLLRQDIRFAAVTGTKKLHRRFEMLGFQPRVLCEADPATLEGPQEQWGRYYESEPRVLAGSLEASILRLNEQLGAVYSENGRHLLPRLHRVS